MPKIFKGLVDDAAVFPPGNASLPDAVSAHRTHRGSRHADLVGPLLVRSSQFTELIEEARAMEFLEVGIIGDSGLGGVDQALGQIPRSGRVLVRQVEIAVAKRGEDPLPGLRDLISWRGDKPFDVYAEIPLTYGCLAALDVLAGETGRAHAKFRTGGLAAELFPTPEELALVIVACAQRGLRFKLTAGLHHAVRHTDPATGFTHHGFLNVLAASGAAAQGADANAVAELLALVDPLPLIEAVRPMLASPRPLWVGFGTCSIPEPLDDLITLGLVSVP
ncbi:MAG: hypothetical protein GEU94_07895 [Micromonosporaceae bacterium]|nr:hypothetical protein [Micromonosporaceae bacterium]